MAQNLAEWVGEPNLILHIRQLLVKQSITPLEAFNPLIVVFPSAIVTFYSPSNCCGTSGMWSECIHTVESWRHGSARYDCVFYT